MKRWTLRIVVFLLLGAIVNVAVAWGCVIRCHCQGVPMDRSSPEESAATWERLAGLGWTAEPTYGCHKYRFGVRALHVQAGEWNSVKPDGQSIKGARYMTNEECAGWPLLGVRYVQRLDSANRPGWIIQGRLDLPIVIGGVPYVPLPMCPIWPGFAINTVFYAAILWLLLAAPFALRRRRRIKRGLCLKCGYNLRGRPSTSDVCPECGAAAPRFTPPVA